ncbi:hypothetical protein Q1695_001370 [Nippostrongylus brasiliensis]|nr:hypothetical protein Q1695_001370 [Nippostrongylus brasiliensis]
MNTAELGFLAALLAAFYITVIHPFIVGCFIAALVGFIRYLAPRIDQQSPNDESSAKESSQMKTTFQGSTTQYSKSKFLEGSQPQTEKKTGKSQREILAEIEAAELEREKYSKLLLTYQVPNMTAYFESLVRIIQN